MPKLTKRTVDDIDPDPSGRDKFVWDSGDGAIKGFGIRMKPSGAGAYLVQYRNKEGRTRRMVIGKVGVLAPDEARDIAAEKLRHVSKGNDPSAERHALRKGMTVQELCDLYLKDAKNRIKLSTWEHDESRINCHVLPLIGNHKVASLTLRDLEKLQTDIAAGKTAKPRKERGRTGATMGGQGVAARTIGMFGTILEFARRNGVINENPARGVKRFADKKRIRYLSSEELKSLGEAIRKGEQQGESKTGIAAIKALLLTGCRRNEILGLPRAWLDINASCIRFEDTKTEAQIRPIGQTAVDHLAAQPEKEVKRENGEVVKLPWVFPSDRREGHFIGLRKILERLCEEAKLKGVIIHTLRHTFCSVAAELGYTELTIAGMVGHKLRGITHRYSHLPDSALLSAADKVSAEIAARLGLKIEKPKAKDASSDAAGWVEIPMRITSQKTEVNPPNAVSYA